MNEYVQKQQQEMLSSAAPASISSVSAERRRSDPALHDIDMLNTPTHTYSTVTGISALRLANYQKACQLELY